MNLVYVIVDNDWTKYIVLNENDASRVADFLQSLGHQVKVKS